jgi:hypothetical protein
VARAERSGAGAFRVRPLGGDEVRQGAAAVRARCRADGGPECRLAAQREVGAVQPRSVRLSEAALTGPPTAAQTGIPICPFVRELCVGREAAEAAPRRRVRWRSRGRRWRGPSARATARPCRLSAVPASPRRVLGHRPGPAPHAVVTQHGIRRYRVIRITRAIASRVPGWFSSAMCYGSITRSSSSAPWRCSACCTIEECGHPCVSRRMMCRWWQRLCAVARLQGRAAAPASAPSPLRCPVLGMGAPPGAQPRSRHARAPGSPAPSTRWAMPFSREGPYRCRL